MAAITDVPPAEVMADLKGLSAALDGAVPAKALDRNLLIATWNIRAFGELTESWKAQETDEPKRDLHALACIAEIVRRFDVVAVQEVKANLKGLRHLLKALGPDWGFLLTDVTRGAPGNDERMAFLYDTRRVKPSGLACELVVPKEWLARVDADALHEQFARTPYAVSFLSAGQTFILVTLHVVYGGSPADRVPELKAIAQWMAAWAKDSNAWHHNLIALGDFNIDRQGDPLYTAFTSTGLHSPDDLNAAPRTIFDTSAGGQPTAFYDQIAWFTGEGGMPALSLAYVKGGHVDFVPHAMTALGLTRQQLSWRLSDHYPLWAEFSIRE